MASSLALGKGIAIMIDYISRKFFATKEQAGYRCAPVGPLLLEERECNQRQSRVGVLGAHNPEGSNRSNPLGQVHCHCVTVVNDFGVPGPPQPHKLQKHSNSQLLALVCKFASFS